ncbi:2975_t:CDS:1, partial [Dentiscutata erythropus]
RVNKSHKHNEIQLKIQQMFRQLHQKSDDTESDTKGRTTRH